MDELTDSITIELNEDVDNETYVVLDATVNIDVQFDEHYVSKRR